MGSGKEPEKPEDGNPVESFLKSSAADIASRLPEPPPAETFGQKLAVWSLRCVFALILGASVPAGTAAVSWGVKTAEEEGQVQKTKIETKKKQKNLQLQLLSQIIEVAKKADFKDPTSLYRLGLIAHMVNENHGVFGIKLQEAEHTMKRMFEKLAPISGLRKRLSESNILIGDLSGKVRKAKKQEKDLHSKLKALREEVQQTKNLAAWKKKRLLEKISEKEQELSEQVTSRRFYAMRLYRERQIRQYFQEQLSHQAKQLKGALRDAAELRDQLKAKADMFQALSKRFNKQGQDSKEILTKLKKALQEISQDHEKAQQTIKRLQDELQSERKEVKLAKQTVEYLKIKCAVPIQKGKTPANRTRKSEDKAATKPSRPAGARRPAARRGTKPRHRPAARGLAAPRIGKPKVMFVPVPAMGSSDPRRRLIDLME